MKKTMPMIQSVIAMPRKMSRPVSPETSATATIGTDDKIDPNIGTRLIVPATVAKGLEFDRVVVMEPTTIAAAEPDERTGLRRLYVVLTRAVTGLTVVHCQPLPAPLRGVHL